MVQKRSQKAVTATPTAASVLSSASPRPWNNSTADETQICDRDGYDIATTFLGAGDYDENYMTRADDAALIVKAVNRDHHFDALVKLVQEILTDELCNNGAPPGVGWFDRAEKLIAALAGAK